MSSWWALAGWVASLVLLRVAFLVPVSAILRDRTGGWTLPFVLALLGYGYWLAAYLPAPPWLPLAASFLFAMVACFAAAHGSAPVARSWRLRAGEEAVFWTVFFAGCAVRARLGEWTGSEKFPDLMYLQAAWQDSPYPPIDRWLHPFAANYYYMSYVFFVPVMKVTAIPPHFAVNLICPTVIALICSTAYAFVGNLTGRARWGILAAAFAGALGNAEWIVQVGQGIFWKSFSWWNSSRAIPFAITEFPFFSFLLGDLHPHYNALPWFGLGLWMAWYVDARRAIPWVALVVGLQYPLNAWQFPVLVLACAWRYRARPRALALIGALSFVLVLPFWLAYQRPVSGIYWVEAGQRTQTAQFIVHWLPFLALLGCAWAFDPDARRPTPREWVGMGALLAISLLDRGAAAFVALFFWWTLLVPMDGMERFLWTFSIAILMFCEFFSLDPTYGYDYFRMNTVFKFYIVLWWVFAALCFVRLARLRWNRRRAAALAAIALVGAVYPVQALRARLGPARDPYTLDGSAYWDRAMPGELAALDWIRARTGPHDVVLEALGPSYQEFGRYAVFSGRPNLMGWMSHEQVWRRNGYLIAGHRWSDLEAVKRDPSPVAVADFLRRYGVRWIVLGRLERETYSPGLLAALASYPVAFAGPGVAVHAARP